MKVKATCKEVTHLLLHGMDRRAPLSERLTIRLHMMICEACPKFERQIQMLTKASARWRQYSQE
ncbi:MAG: zf-HC2 domain-containing protein [Burkholderiales bacterium]